MSGVLGGGGFVLPLVNPGDTLYLDDAGVPRRLAVGGQGQFLGSHMGLPSWRTPGSPDVGVNRSTAAGGAIAWDARGLQGVSGSNPGNTIDGDDMTVWFFGGGSPRPIADTWVAIDLGAAYSIASVRLDGWHLDAGSPWGSGQFASDWDIETSVDGSPGSWVLLYTRHMLANDDTFDLPVPTLARYWRIHWRDGGNWGAGGLFTVGLYAP